MNWSIAIALMIGGAIAAPFAAWLVSHVAPRVLGTAVGGLILLTNMRTLLNHFGVGGGVRSAVYLVIAACWATAVVVAIKAVRRERQLGAEPVGVING
jgi:hypothetical protein